MQNIHRHSPKGKFRKEAIFCYLDRLQLSMHQYYRISLPCRSASRLGAFFTDPTDKALEFPEVARLLLSVLLLQRLWAQTLQHGIRVCMYMPDHIVISFLVHTRTGCTNTCMYCSRHIVNIRSLNESSNHNTSTTHVYVSSSRYGSQQCWLARTADACPNGPS